MEPFYSIILKESEHQYHKFLIKINFKHQIYQGHFPDFPIVPGVVLVQIVKELTELAITKKLRLKEASNIKFLKMVRPDSEVEIFAILTIEQNDFVEVNAEFLLQNETCFKMSAVFE